MATETPRPGDCIISENGEGSYDVMRVTVQGAHEIMREGLTTLDTARDTARANLESGRILVRHHSAPDQFERFA